MAVVYTGGTFDLFHAGHVNFLRQCYNISRLRKPEPVFHTLGTYEKSEVTVSLNSDEFIKSFKGAKPLYSYEERKALLLGCRYVDNVILNRGGKDSRPAILDVRPEFIIIGSDWATKDYYTQMGFTQTWLDENNIALIYVPYTEGISTSELKGRIANA